MAAAACLGIAVNMTVGALRPAPPAGVDVLVAAHHLPAGAALTAADLRVVTLPERAAVPEAIASEASRAALVGRTTAVPVPAGLPLVPQVLAGVELTGPAGTVVAAVRLADGAMAALLAPGDRVDLLAAPVEGGPGVTLARAALVLPSARQSGGSRLLGTDDAASPPLLVAVAADEAAALAGAGLSHALFAVVVS